ncbi:MAG TPA: hypothetical protein DD379_06325 [Cyanobacteria bacterium UBA11162]|nr:hypothetical protein [Cyanobacteria bacterium UBA11162]
MLRNPEYPEKSWEDLEAELEENPERPFFAIGATTSERDRYAKERCKKYDRIPEKHPYTGGNIFYTCVKPKQRKGEN